MGLYLLIGLVIACAELRALARRAEEAGEFLTGDELVRGLISSVALWPVTAYTFARNKLRGEPSDAEL